MISIVKEALLQTKQTKKTTPETKKGNIFLFEVISDS